MYVRLWDALHNNLSHMASCQMFTEEQSNGGCVHYSSAMSFHSRYLTRWSRRVMKIWAPSVRFNIRRIRSPAFVRRLWVVEEFLKSRQMTHDADSLPSLGFCLIKSLKVWRDLERPDGSITPLAPFALQLSIEPCPPQGHRPPLSPAHPNATGHKPRPTIHVVNQSTHYHTNLL